MNPSKTHMHLGRTTHFHPSLYPRPSFRFPVLRRGGECTLEACEDNDHFVHHLTLSCLLQQISYTNRPLKDLICGVVRERGARNTKTTWVFTTSLLVCTSLYVCPALQTMITTTQITTNLHWTPRDPRGHYHLPPYQLG